jgi:hypothetical protein
MLPLRYWRGVSQVCGIKREPEQQILRLTTPKLKDVWGPFAQDDSVFMMRISETGH